MGLLGHRAGPLERDRANFGGHSSGKEHTSDRSTCTTSELDEDCALQAKTNGRRCRYGTALTKAKGDDGIVAPQKPGGNTNSQK